jgi:hypothetical protein
MKLLIACFALAAALLMAFEARVSIDPVSDSIELADHDCAVPAALSYDLDSKLLVTAVSSATSEAIANLALLRAHREAQMKARFRRLELDSSIASLSLRTSHEWRHLVPLG